MYNFGFDVLIAMPAVKIYFRSKLFFAILYNVCGFDIIIF